MFWRKPIIQQVKFVVIMYYSFFFIRKEYLIGLRKEKTKAKGVCMPGSIHNEMLINCQRFYDAERTVCFFSFFFHPVQ